MIDIVFYIIGFICFVYVIIKWRKIPSFLRKTILRVAYFTSFLGIIIRFLIDGYYPPKLITAFSFLFIGFIFSEIYNILYKGEEKK